MKLSRKLSGAAALIVLPFDFRQALTNSLIGMVIVLSYVVITGYVGQISVMQLALSGTAGFVLSHLSVRLGIPFPFSALGAMVLAHSAHRFSRPRGLVPLDLDFGPYATAEVHLVGKPSALDIPRVRVVAGYLEDLFREWKG